MKVNFLILGAQKGGSTWLYDNIRQHPMVFTPEKELHYFSNDENFKKGIEWYHGFFSENNLIGEKTPEYLTVIPTKNPRTSVETPQRIHEYNPDMKLIVVLREPISRLKSAANHMIRTQHVSPFTSLKKIISGPDSENGSKFSLLESGLYYHNLEKYLQLFKREQLLILFYETDVVQHPLGTLKRLCLFLDIPYDESYFVFKDDIRNEYTMSKPALILNHFMPELRAFNNRLNHFFSAYRIPTDEDTILFLKNYYRESNQKLLSLCPTLPDNWNY
jgi:hypothetical protein